MKARLALLCIMLVLVSCATNNQPSNQGYTVTRNKNQIIITPPPTDNASQNEEDMNQASVEAAKIISPLTH